MDGVVPTTLSAVLIASASAVGSAIYKVIFKKLMGCVTFAQVWISLISLSFILSNIQPSHNLLMVDDLFQVYLQRKRPSLTEKCPIFICQGCVTAESGCQLVS